MKPYQISGLKFVEIPHESYTEYCITLQAGWKDMAAIESNINEIAVILKNNGAQIISQTVFGPLSFYEAAIQRLEQIFNELTWPVTWFESNGSGELGGTHLRAILGVQVSPLYFADRIIGSFYEDPNAFYCYLGDVRSDDAELSRNIQARETFEKIDKVLNSVGMNFNNTVRTWFYLDNLLEWYQDFNAVRCKFFTERNIFDGIIPASTGVGGRNPARAALSAELLAIRPISNHLQIRVVASPLQCPALQYGSTFSRAIEVRARDYKRLLISGTASISADGESLHSNNMAAQINQTMEVVYAILESCGMKWENITRAVAYVKSNDNHNLKEYLKRNNLLYIPLIITRGEICRDELLFEIEIDAIDK